MLCTKFLDLKRCTRVSVDTIGISKEDSTTKARELSYVANCIPLTNPRHLAASRAVCLASHSKLVAANLPDLPHPLKAKLHRPIYADKFVLSNGGYDSFWLFLSFLTKILAETRKNALPFNENQKQKLHGVCPTAVTTICTTRSHWLLHDQSIMGEGALPVGSERPCWIEEASYLVRK